MNVYECSSTLNLPPHLHSLSLGGIYLTTVTVRFFIQRSVFYFPPSLRNIPFSTKIIIIS